MIAIAPLFKGTLPAHNALAGRRKVRMPASMSDTMMHFFKDEIMMIKFHRGFIPDY